MEPRVWVKSITFSDGSVLDFAADDVIVIVSPNNSGKSATLRAVRAMCESSLASNAVVKRVDFVRDGTTQEVVEWLRRTTKLVESSPGYPRFQTLGNDVQMQSVGAFWGSLPANLHNIAGFFCRLLSADERLQASNPPANIAITRDPLSHPIHYLYCDDGLEERLSKHFRKAFGSDIVVHRAAGGQVPIHVGEKPQPSLGHDRVSHEYLQELEKLPTIHTQGDGMRSFLGILLFAMVGNETVLLIDEPEAFLHPPQARHLGRVLVTDGSPSQQLFLATHSGDVLRGALDTESSRVRILRIRRSGDINIVRELKNSEVVSVWSDPLLRYSNILDGLFHERVVICESDADCRFYAAVMDAIFEHDDEDRRKPDVMFTHCGGKARLPLVIQSLRDLDVPMSIVADFDVLSTEEPLKKIFEAAGGEWDSIEPDWRNVKNAIDSKKPELSTDEVKRDIESVFDNASSSYFPATARKKIQSILRRSSPWSTAKSVGAQYIPSGQPSQAYSRMVTELEKVGIFVVPVGELEGFVKDVGGHGPSWVAEALKRDLAHDADLQSARTFVGKLFG